MGYSLLHCGSFIRSEVLTANLLQYGLLFMETQVLPGTFSSAGLPQGHSLSGTHTPGSTMCSAMDCMWISAPLGPPWAGFKCDSGITIHLHVQVSAETEFIFFLVARTVLCFGVTMRTILITQWRFQLLLSSTYPKSRTFWFPSSCC